MTVGRTCGNKEDGPFSLLINPITMYFPTTCQSLSLLSHRPLSSLVVSHLSSQSSFLEALQHCISHLSMMAAVCGRSISAHPAGSQPYNILGSRLSPSTSTAYGKPINRFNIDNWLTSTQASQQPKQLAAAQAGSKPDPCYGHENTAHLCTRFITQLFACPKYPPTSSGSNTNLPYLIAYALHRTKLHSSVTFAALVLLQRLKARFPPLAAHWATASLFLRS